MAGRLILVVALMSLSRGAQAESVTCDQIYSLVRSYQDAHAGEAMSLDELVMSLPETFRSRFTLMRSSQSLQAATDANPRVIMFGYDAQTVLTFNGSSEQGGFDKLEMACVDPATNLLAFRFIQWQEVEGRTTATLSEANPSQCMGCHGQIPHYNWDDYPRWGGAYGRQDDFMFQRAEVAAFSAFKAAAAEHVRYRALVWLDSIYGQMYPYRIPSPPTMEAVEVRANWNFSASVTRRQGVDRVKRAAASPRFESHGYSLAMYASGCDELIDMSSVAARTGIRSFDEALRLFEIDHDRAGRFYLNQTSPGTYGDGFLIYREVLATQTWNELVSRDSSLRPFYRPVTLQDFQATYGHGVNIAISPMGFDVLSALDRVSPAILHVPRERGSRLDAYFNSPPFPTLDDARVACLELERRQMAALP